MHRLHVPGAGAPDLRSGPLPIPRWQVEQTLPAETAPERPRSEVLRDDVRARAERFAARAPEEAPDASALPQTAPTAASSAYADGTGASRCRDRAGAGR